MEEQIKLETNPEKHIRLGLKERNFLQAKVIERMLADGQLGSELDWLKHPYSKVVSQIIDNPENGHIREMATNGQFAEAAEILEKILIEMDIAHQDIGRAA
ncbi:MAG: hypothetical protein WAV11_03190 [Minisyncoccia bacterium]